jgi:hypothetical protein
MSPWMPQWYMVNGGYSEPTVTTPSDLKISWVTVNPISTTSAVVTFAIPNVTPGSYGGAIASNVLYSGPSDPDFKLINTTTNTYTQTGLTPGKTYFLRARAFSGSNTTGTYGEYIYEVFTMPKLANVASTSATTSSTTTPSTTTTDELTKTKLVKILAAGQWIETEDLSGNSVSATENLGTSTAFSGNRQLQKSYLKIQNKNKDLNSYALSIKNTGISTSYSKYSFGTGILFASTLDEPTSGGGFGFFTNETGTNGYFIELQTDQSNKDLKDKSLKIYKVVNTKKIYLTDSQDGKDGKLVGGVLTSTLYKLDVDVTISNGVTVIDVYVNNFKVTAIDSTVPNTTDPKKKVISPTPFVALFSILHSTAFDYVYANPISDTQIVDAASRKMYEGQYALATINFAFGEKIAQDFNSPEGKVAYLEEFGKTVRELRYVKTNFSQPAAIPLYATTGINKFATILGSKFSNHTAEIFVINNASSFIPLAVGNEQQFAVLGNYVDNGSQHEYTESTESEYTVLEPAIFQSTWIQSEADAKSLFGWIKNQWSKQQQSINMEIFGNPSIEVGDIITINYAKNDLTESKKFLVTSINLSFEGGISTSLTARSIYSV